MKRLDGGHGFGAHLGVNAAGIKAGRCQPFLQGDAFLKRQRAFVARPRREDGSCAAQAVGQMAHGDDIGIGGVVGLDHMEVLEDQERRAPVPAGQKDRGRAMVGQIGAVGQPNPHRLPVGDRFFHPFGRQVIVEPGRQGDFGSPWRALDPAFAGQIGGG